MKRFLHEIHRRSLWQVLGVYIAASWVALQVVNEIGDAVGLPQWVAGGALVLLVIGFPIVIATAFVQHGGSPGAVSPSAPGSSLGASAPVPGPDPAAADSADGAAGPSPASTDRPPTRGHHRWFTWRNAVLGGVGAFVLLGAGTGVWMGLRAAGIGPAGTLVAKGALEESALLVLADFEADDAALGEAATEALRVDLSQSGTIRLAEPATIADALERMGRDENEALTGDLAAEIAVREGAAGVISGEINRAGAGRLFSARIVTATDGTVLTSQRESAADEADVIPAIDRLSKKLRERIGDSFRELRGDPPLARVTTSSLEALKLYSRASAGDGDRLALLRQAVEVDPGFAMAWRALGIIYRNRNNERAKMIEAFTRAFEARDRLTERERHQAASIYYTVVEFDPERASIEYQALLDLDPEDESATTNLGVLASTVGDHERAAGWALRSVELDPEGHGPGYWNAVTSLVNTGRIDEADAMADSALKAWGERAGVAPRLRLMVLAAQGRLDEAEANFRRFLERDLPPEWRARLALNLGQFAATRGRLAAAEGEIRIRTAFAAEAGDAEAYFEAAVQGAWTDVVVRERPDRAVTRLEAALDRFPLADMAPLDRPYLELAEVFARAGRPQVARQLVEDMRASVDAPGMARVSAQLRRVEGEIGLAEGRPEEAIESFRPAVRDFCHICPLPGMALAYEAAGQPDSAAAVHRRYVETPYSDRFLPYTYPLGQALGPEYERLGELYDQLGDLESAAKFYASFVELWADADEELQPRVRAAQARLQEIMEARG